jgi:hypothetical protein
MRWAARARRAILPRMTTLPAQPLAGPRPRITARFAGVLSLMTILGGVFAQGYVANRLISPDAAVTATNILANRPLFQLSYTIFLIEMACQVATSALFYALLRPVNRDIALVAAFLDLAGSVMKTMTRVFYITPLFVLSGNQALSAFSTDQLRALAMLLFKINDRGAGMALAFFGVSGVLNSYLIFRSTFLPRTLGILSMVASVGWLRFFYPPLRFPPFMVIAVVALLVAAVKIYWLIVYGVDEEKWKEKAESSLHIRET